MIIHSWRLPDSRKLSTTLRRLMIFLGLSSDLVVASSSRSCAFSPSRSRLSSMTRTASAPIRSEEHTSELQSVMRISYAVFCLKKTMITDEIQYKHTVSKHPIMCRLQHSTTRDK